MSCVRNEWIEFTLKDSKLNILAVNWENKNIQKTFVKYILSTFFYLLYLFFNEKLKGVRYSYDTKRRKAG